MIIMNMIHEQRSNFQKKKNLLFYILEISNELDK